MADIQIGTDEQKDLTTFTVKGTLTADNILKAINDFYKNPTRLVLWHANDTVLNEISPADLENATRLISEVKTGRPEGKTAFVIGKDDFSLGVLFEGFSKIEHLPYEYRSFTSEDEAMHWLLNE